MNITTSTPLIEVESGAYPKYLADVRQANPQLSFSNQPTEEFLASLGYAPVNRNVQPAVAVNQVVEERAPVLVDGVWQQVWVGRDMTDAEEAAKLAISQSELSNQVERLRIEAFQKGFPYDFGGEHGELGVQCRDIDKTNLLGLRTVADAFVEAGQPDAPMVFRTAENINVELMAADMVSVTNAAFQFANKVYAASWSLKDQIDKAKQLLELPVVPAVLEI